MTDPMHGALIPDPTQVQIDGLTDPKPIDVDPVEVPVDPKAEARAEYEAAAAVAAGLTDAVALTDYSAPFPDDQPVPVAVVYLTISTALDTGLMTILGAALTPPTYKAGSGLLVATCPIVADYR